MTIMQRVCCAGIALSMLLFTGCATNKRVTTSTINKNTMKFVYVQSDLFGSYQGIIKCELNEAGDLTNCREMGVTFKEGGE